MESFFIALTSVAVMLLYACPGFLMVRTGLVKGAAISDFAKLLMYVCQPALTIYSFMQAEFSLTMVRDMLFVFAFVLCLFAAALLFFRFVVFRKKAQDVRYRIYTLAICFSNCAFMGVPVLEALLPDYPQAVVFSAMFALAMNILGWTLASAIITNDKKYMSVKKIVLNPAVLSLLVAVPLFVSGVRLPVQLDSMITLLARMTTPLCMLIMGMRLATARLASVFASPAKYIIAVVKGFAFPLLALGLLLLFPVEKNLRAAVYIMMACPAASVVLNFAEMLGEGQETAAGLVLLSTVLSAVTIPVMVMII
ncbi:MAG: AEC family transporter [Clostridia bacterium]|nr:AEC family transporter [Clostridia bacterium]